MLMCISDVHQVAMVTAGGIYTLSKIQNGMTVVYTGERIWVKVSVF